MKTVRVNASTPYDVLIGHSLLDSLGSRLKGSIGECKICIVTDDKVDDLYSVRAQEALQREGYSYNKFVIKNGEASKNTQNLIALLEFLAENAFTRSDCIVSLGGGVVGDLSGFAAGIYLRGIRFVQVPTTLLAAVDSSVGGKTAVDLAAGKNLAGVFHQPSLVLCDVETLDTLEENIFADGCAEVIKYAVINDRPMFERLQKGIKDNIEEVIFDCVTHKAEIVQSDEFDRGCRQLLNLGHTVGHAIEHCSNFEISHGSAVAIGTTIVMKMACSLGLCDENDYLETVKLLKANALPTKCNFNAEELARVAGADKKRSGATITLVVPHGIGNCKLMAIPYSELCTYIEKGL